MRNVLILSAVVALAATASGCGSSAWNDPPVQASVVADMRRVDSATAGGGAAGGGGTGWGALKGRFVFNGAPPAMGPQPGFDPAKDPLCKPVTDHSLLVDSGSKGIANILVFLVEASRINPDLDAAPPKEVVFDQKECRFLSPITALRVKDKLVVLNTDTTAHNTNSAPPRGNPPFNVLLEKLNGRFDYQFKNNLVMPTDATCSIHPWMKAYIIARPDPYFAVSGKDGSFEIAKLPAGEELEFQVWHEKATNGLKALPQWSAKGRFKVTIGKDGEVVDMKDIVVEPSALGL